MRVSPISRRAGRGASLVRAALSIAAGLAVGWAAWRWTASPASAVAAADPGAGEVSGSQPGAGVTPARSTKVPRFNAVSGRGGPGYLAGDAIAAGRALEVVYRRVRDTRAEAPERAPETAANLEIGFLTGWIDAIRHTSPELIDELRGLIRSKLCSGEPPAEELILTAYLLQRLPESISQDGLDCFFDQHSKEDAPLWYMLDAWRLAGMPATPAITALPARASDPRTLRRFESPEESSRNRAIRAAGAQSSRKDPSPWSRSSVISSPSRSSSPP
jgi:hypothetical protein